MYSLKQNKYITAQNKYMKLAGHLLVMAILSMTTINGERFTGLNIHSSSLWIFSWEHFCGPLTSSVYYLTIAKYLRENFCGTLKNCENHESLAQRIFPRLQYLIKNVQSICLTKLNFVQPYTCLGHKMAYENHYFELSTMSHTILYKVSNLCT